MKSGNKPRKPAVKRRKRRLRRRHYRVTVTYRDGDKFARVYTDLAKATSFAEQQKKSHVVRDAIVVEVGRQGLRD